MVVAWNSWLQSSGRFTKIGTRNVGSQGGWFDAAYITHCAQFGLNMSLTPQTPLGVQPGFILVMFLFLSVSLAGATASLDCCTVI